ncbi:MAG: non-canonical purine NTP pyrophosphatase [Candidatus Saccharibacteria bacterium]
MVEDVALTFHALGKLPGPFIKWFLQELSHRQLCDLLGPGMDRSATSAVCYGWFDGTELRFFDGQLPGSIAMSPRGTGGFGFDPIFVPNGSVHTHAEMDDTEVERFGLRATTVYPQLREFLRA